MNSIIIQFRVASPCDFTRGPHKVAFWVFLGICWLYNVIHLYYPLTAFARRETSLQCRFCKRGPHLVEGFAGRISLSWIQLRYINTSCFSWLCLTTWKKTKSHEKKHLLPQMLRQNHTEPSLIMFYSLYSRCWLHIENLKRHHNMTRKQRILPIDSEAVD